MSYQLIPTLVMLKNVLWKTQCWLEIYMESGTISKVTKKRTKAKHSSNKLTKAACCLVKLCHMVSLHSYIYQYTQNFLNV